MLTATRTRLVWGGGKGSIPDRQRNGGPHVTEEEGDPDTILSTWALGKQEKSQKEIQAETPGDHLALSVSLLTDPGRDPRTPRKAPHGF